MNNIHITIWYCEHKKRREKNDDHNRQQKLDYVIFLMEMMTCALYDLGLAHRYCLSHLGPL